MIPFPANSVNSRRGVLPKSPSAVASGVFWLDASAGLVLSGSNVTTWTDQISGLASTTLGTAPTYDATGIGGAFPGVVFSGGVLRFSLGPILSGATSYAVIMVCQDTATAVNSHYIFEYGTSGASTPGQFCVLPNFPGTNASLAHFSPGSAGANRYYADAGTADLVSISLLTFACDYTKASHEVAACRLNGADLAGTWQTDTDSSGTTLANVNLYIGGTVGLGDTCWPGTIGDFCILRNPTPYDIASVEAYFQ